MRKLLICGVMMCVVLSSCSSASREEPAAAKPAPAPLTYICEVSNDSPDGINPCVRDAIESYAEENQKFRVVELPKAEEQAPEAPAYSAEELEILALVIYQEAGGDACSDDTRLMVGCVFMNRVEDSRFPDGFYGVATQQGQYGTLHWTGIKWPARSSAQGEQNAVARAYAIAERVLTGERVLPANAVWQAEFPQGSEVLAYSDGMYFCR